MPRLSPVGAASLRAFGFGSLQEYLMQRSLRFRASNSAYLNRTLTTPTNNLKWTWSGWVKRGTLGGQYLFCTSNTDASPAGYIYFAGAANQVHYWDRTQGTDTVVLQSSASLRDHAAWYHIIVTVDRTQATASDRAKMYINGQQVTSFATTAYPNQNETGYINSAVTHYISANTAYFDGYMAEVNFIDGQALTPASFGKVNQYGTWSPIKYGGTYGNNGFYLPFANNTSTTSLGWDFGPNGNDWTLNNFSLAAGSTYDSMTDVPTLTSSTTANYCVMNPLNPYIAVISNGNLRVAATNDQYAYSEATIYATASTKFYAEATLTSYNSGGTDTYVAMNGINYRADGTLRNGDTVINTYSTYGQGDVIGVAFDGSTRNVSFYKNNTLIVTYAVPTADGYVLALYANFFSITWDINFGQQPFVYTPPSGYLPLNTYNM